MSKAKVWRGGVGGVREGGSIGKKERPKKKKSAQNSFTPYKVRVHGYTCVAKEIGTKKQ